MQFFSSAGEDSLHCHTHNRLSGPATADGDRHPSPGSADLSEESVYADQMLRAGPGCRAPRRRHSRHSISADFSRQRQAHALQVAATPPAPASQTPACRDRNGRWSHDRGHPVAATPPGFPAGTPDRPVRWAAPVP